MEPQACRNQLARLLSDETRLLGTLEQQLRREHELLGANDVDALEQVGSARQESVAALLRVDDQRRDLCRLLGRNPDHTGLAALLKWCDPEGSLSAAYSQCAELAQSCRTQNDRNGILVNARLNRVTGMLGMLGAGTNVAESRTYAAQHAPRAAAVASHGRLLSISA
jgi:flagellar biosynthesis protein FlgN